jgi:MFS family permease
MADKATVRATGGRKASGDGQGRRALTVMTASHAIQHFYVGGLAVSYPFVVAQFHISYALLGVLLTVAGVIGGVLQAAAGLLRRFGSAVVLGAQNLGMAGASWLGAVAPGIGVFGAARVLGSVVSWPQHPVGSAYLSRRFPDRRATVLSWHVAGGSAGTVAAPLAVSAVIAAAGWRWALGLVGAMTAAGGLLVWLALPAETGPGAAPAGEEPAGEEPAGFPSAEAAWAAGAGPRRSGAHPASPGPAAGPVRPPAPVPLRTLLARRRVIAVLAASTIAAGGRGLGTLTTYIPAYLRSGLHLPALSVGTLFTVVMAASVAGPVVGGHLADRFGRTRTLVITYLSGAAAVAAFGYVGSSVLALGFVGVCAGVLAYSESPLLQALFSELTDDGAARTAFGAFFALGYGVGSLWTAVIGWIITTFGFPAAFATMAGSFVVSAAVITAFVRDRR